MIPSLLQIPSAVSDSKLHSVLPNNGKGDFQFERSTGATRINKDGLIEEIGYFSSELVQNGNFSELGSELVTNGDFATDSDWTKGGSWIINNGKASIDYNDGSDGRLTQGISFTQNKTYKVVFTISNYVSGNFKIEFRFGGSSTVSSSFNANGTYTLYLTAGQNHSQFSIRALNNPIGSIDNVSVKQVDPNDRWTTSLAKNVSGWLIENDVASCDGTQSTNSGFIQASVFESGKNYMLKFDLTSNGQAIKFWVNGSQNIFSSALASGSYKYEFTTTVGGSAYFEATANFVGTLDNVSVVEVQGDRPRLSYDITNGVVEKQPHLLLEPSSTNLVKFSEDFNQWTLGSNAILTFESDIEAPDGTLGVYRLKLPATGSTFIQSNSFASSNPLSVSIYAKATGTGNNNFNLYTGGSNISPLKTATDKWQRFEYTASGTDFFLINSGDSFITDVYIWGAQAEALSFATSLIPTAGTTITRAAETCNNSKPSVNSPEGVLYAEVKSFSETGSAGVFTLSDGSNSNRVKIELDGGVVKGRVDVGGSGIGLLNYTVGITNYLKIALKWKASDFELWVNGSARASITSGSSFSANTLNEVSFDRGDGGEDFYGKVKGLAVYNEALTDAQLIELTS